MPKVIVSVDGVVIKEIQLTKDRTTVGRRPYNDIVIDNLAVSGEHAVLLLTGTQVTVEDHNSTNGTFVNGRQVRSQALQHDDVVEVGRYQLRVVEDQRAGAGGPVSGPSTIFSVSRPAAALDSQPVEPAHAVVRVLDGPGAGRELSLTKVVTTLGKPGVVIAAITRKRHGFALAHVDGKLRGQLNGAELGDDPVELKSGDVITLADIRMEFQVA